MIFYIKLLSICLSSFILEDEMKTSCPLEYGTIAPRMNGFVVGVKWNKSVKILGSKESKVYSISDGVIKHVGMRSEIIRIIKGDITYEYFGISPEVEVGQFVSKGDILGQLDLDFLILKIRKEDQEVEARDYIDCIGK